jgi:ABC-2 type transport system permease protein
VVTAGALISLMFLIMVRVANPLIPRSLMGIFATVLYFPSGAVYPVEGLPPWLRPLSSVDPFTFSVRAMKEVLLKNTDLTAVRSDLLYLLSTMALTLTCAAVLFRRRL